MDLTLFNPRSQSEPDFIASFVARKDTLEFFLRQLRQLGAEEPAHHQLIVAPRGYGKTSLLRRIAIAVRTDDSLSRRYLPLSFREEQHNVISLDVFWRNCIQSLLEAREEEHASETELDEIDGTWTRLAPRHDLPRAAQDGEPQWQELRRRCESLGRRPILLIDNLDTLLAGLDSNHQWTLRQTLQTPDGPVLLAAASRYPESTHEQAAAFYEFFRIQTLDRLENEEVFSCLRTLAQHRGAPGKAVIELLDRDPGRIAALNVLAGGNPRTLGVLYTVLESHMSTDVLSQLSAMLDTFTGWYQARTEELPMQARAVFDALALNWDPMTAADLSKTTGLETGAVSSQISRLERLGYVEPVALSRRGKGRSGYQLVERFFNIWYLMRNGPRRARQSIRFLVVFLQSCFSPSERRALGHWVLDSEGTDPGYAVALASTMGDSKLRQRLLDRAHELSVQSPASSDYHAMILELTPREPQQATTEIGNNRKSRKEQAQSPSVHRTPTTAADDVATGRDLAAQRKFHEAITIFNRVIDRSEVAPDAATQRHVARALVSKGIALRQLGRGEEAVAVYDDVAARYGQGTEPGLQEQVARARVNKGIALRQLGRGEDAVAVYDDVAVRYGQAAEPALQEQAARARVNKGFALGQLGRAEEAVVVYDDVAARYGQATEPALRGQVARALVNKGYALGQLGRADEAAAVYDDVAVRYGQATEPALQEQVVQALVNKGIALRQLGRAEEAVAVYDNVAVRYGQAVEPALQEHVARALVNKGYVLGLLGRAEEEVAVYDDVAARYGQATEPALQEKVAQALVNKGIALRQLGRTEEAVAVYDDVATRYGQATEPAQQEKVARALVNKGFALRQLGRAEEEVAVCDDVVTRYGQAIEPALQEQVARALANKGFTLGQLGRAEEEVAVYDDMAARYGQATELVLQEQVARALVNKGYALGQLGRAEEAVAVYDDVAARHGQATEPALQERVAQALVNKGIALRQLGRAEEAVAVYEGVAARYGQATEPALQEMVAQALLNKGFALRQLGRAEEAVAVYDDVAARHGQATEPALQGQAARALVNKGYALGQLGRSEEAVAVYEDVAALYGQATEQALQEQVVRALRGVFEIKRTAGELDAAVSAARRAVTYSAQQSMVWNSLGNLLFDQKGDVESADQAYQQGLLVAKAENDIAILSSNRAYLLALHAKRYAEAQAGVQRALSLADGNVSDAGRHLLMALPTGAMTVSSDWAAMFNAIASAVHSNDSGLWSRYLDDLQRLIWYVVAHDQGDALRTWMEGADYPLRQAPLYHAVVAAIEGEDHLLKINPEVRGPANRIYEGIARLLKLYGKGNSSSR